MGKVADDIHHTKYSTQVLYELNIHKTCKTTNPVVSSTAKVSANV